MYVHVWMYVCTCMYVVMLILLVTYMYYLPMHECLSWYMFCFVMEVTEGLLIVHTVELEKLLCSTIREA